MRRMQETEDEQPHVLSVGENDGVDCAVITCFVPKWRIVYAAFFSNDFLDQSGADEEIVNARILVGSLPIVGPMLAAAVAQPQVHHVVWERLSSR